MLTEPMGKTRQSPTSLARCRTNSIAATLSSGGLVLGMQQTVVNPPVTAAALPVAIVSLCSSPGSRKWTCMSTKPGTTNLPVQSITSAPSAIMFSATVRILPSLVPRPSSRSINTSRFAIKFCEGSTIVPFLRSNRLTTPKHLSRFGFTKLLPNPQANEPALDEGYRCWARQ